MCGPCLNPGLSKPTIKCHFWAKSGYLILDWVLDDINFVSRANNIVIIYRNILIFYRRIGTWCMRFAWKHWRVTAAKIKEKNAERSTWNKYGKMSTLELGEESIIWLCLQSFIIKTLKWYLEFCKLTMLLLLKRSDHACNKRKLKSIKKKEWKFWGKTANEVMDADSIWKREVCNTLEICRNKMRIIMLMIKITANTKKGLTISLLYIRSYIYLTYMIPTRLWAR